MSYCVAACTGLLQWGNLLSALAVILITQRLLTHYDLQSVTIPHCDWMLQTALRLTDAQQADMLHLRKLFHAKVGAVRRERAGLWPKVPVEVAMTAADATIKMLATSSLAQQLQESGAAEFRATMQFGSAFNRGVGPVLVDLKQFAAAA